MPDPLAIAFVGLSGVGKSRIGRHLAERLGWPLRDTDALIAEAEGRTVAQMFADWGEPRFRDLESGALQQALASRPCIVSTGGGIVLRPGNRVLLRAHAFVVWLDAPTELLVARLLAHDEDRPLIGGSDPAARLEALRAARAGLYAEVAHVRIDTTGYSVDAICEQVLHLFAHTTINPEELIGKNWSAIRKAARVFLAQSPSDVFAQVTAWYGHSAWEVRSFALALLGGLAGRDPRALTFLFEHCGDEPAWQANEALAMAFDDYCAAVGYQQALPTIRQWLQAPHANLRRAVSEGLRPWIAAKRFATAPQLAIDLLGTLKDDPSRYVQESVGNALRDISRKHFDLVLGALRAWLAEQPHSKARRTVAKYALEKAVKEDPALRELY